MRQARYRTRRADAEVVARRAEERFASWRVVAGAVARLQVVEEQLADG